MTMAIILVCALAGGVTFALFTSSSSNSTNTFTAGTVKLNSVRDNYDTVPGPMFYTTPEQGRTYDGERLGNNCTGEWVPGMTKSRVLIVSNAGTLEARLTRIKASVDSSSSLQPGTTAYEEFINKMNVKITAPSNDTGSVEVYNGSLAGLMGDGAAANGNIVFPVGTDDWPAPNVPLTFECYLDISAGNVLQGTNPVFSFSVIAEQNKNNP